MMAKRTWPAHELANYRIALDKYYDYSKRHGASNAELWEKVRGNALRLAEAIDIIDKRRK